MKFRNVKKNGITCLLLIITSLFCVSFMYSFTDHEYIRLANNIKKLILNNYLRTKTMDLEM